MVDPIVLSPIPLNEFVGEVVKGVRDEFAAQSTANPPAPEELITRKDAAHLLSITLPTLRAYTRSGLLKGYRIGSRVRYKRSEVLNGLAPIRTRNTDRP